MLMHFTLSKYRFSPQKSFLFNNTMSPPVIIRPFSCCMSFISFFIDKYIPRNHPVVNPISHCIAYVYVTYYVMPLKPGGDRDKLIVTLKKTNIKRLKEYAKAEYRPVSQTLDMIIELYFAEKERNLSQQSPQKTRP